MLDNNKLQLILNEISYKNLFEDFISMLLCLNKNDVLKSIIRYKVKDIFIIDIFSNDVINKYTRYNFINLDNDCCIEEKNVDGIVVNDIYIKKCYKEKELFNNNAIILFASLYAEKNKKKILFLLKKIFNDEIITIFIKYLFV